MRNNVTQSHSHSNICVRPSGVETTTFGTLHESLQSDSSRARPESPLRLCRLTVASHGLTAANDGGHAAGAPAVSTLDGSVVVAAAYRVLTFRSKLGGRKWNSMGLCRQHACPL